MCWAATGIIHLIMFSLARLGLQYFLVQVAWCIMSCTVCEIFSSSAPLCFCVTLLLFLSPAGGPAKGNPHQLPDSGGLFCTGFIKSIAELIKGCILNECTSEEWGGVERTANRGQDPRQEEGIPSPSSQLSLMRRAAREHPCLFPQPARPAARTWHTLC